MIDPSPIAIDPAECPDCREARWYRHRVTGLCLFCHVRAFPRSPEALAWNRISRIIRDRSTGGSHARP